MTLTASDIYPSSRPDFFSFPSRRSVVHSANGMVACSQPLAAQAGQRILRAGGNAADAAVAVSAALNMTEPCSTGIGGDMFCLFYNARTRKVKSLNGSGRSSGSASLEEMRKDLDVKPGEPGVIPLTSVHAVSIPGAAAGWVDTVEKFGSGKLSLLDILMPAIELGEEGFPVTQMSSKYWHDYEERILKASPNFGEMLKTDSKAPHGKRAPRPGELFYNPTLANTFRLLARNGKAGFYEGPVAEAVVKVVQDLGGHLTLDDMKHHAQTGTEETKPISLLFKGQKVEDVQSTGLGGQPSQSLPSQSVEVWEHPPNGQGIVALMALGILEELEKTGKVRKLADYKHNSTDYLHALIEALRISFADAAWFVTDPNVAKVPTEEMISKPYLAERAKLFDPNKASEQPAHGSPAHNKSDTVYFATTDKDGNGCSFINSNYKGFGTCIIPKGCGFTLQNRAAGFSLVEGHPNVFAPRKRPYHTIIPSIITNADDGSLHSVFGVMAGYMQPQGHVQILLNMLAFKYDPQTALDAPRFCIGSGMPGDMPNATELIDTIYLEDGIDEKVRDDLRALGHNAHIIKGYGRDQFGKGQVIRCHMEDGRHVFSGGSDPRGDGAALPV